MNIVDVRANNAYHQIFSCIYKSLFVICTTGGPLEMRILVLGKTRMWKLENRTKKNSNLQKNSHIQKTPFIKFAYLIS